MGFTDVTLEIKINRTSEWTILSQSHYIDTILENINKDDKKEVRVPIILTRI